MKRKPTPKTKRMTFADFKRRCRKVYTLYFDVPTISHLTSTEEKRIRRAIKAAWLLPCLLISTSFGQLATNAPIAFCESVNCYDYGSWYIVLAVPAPAGHLKEFTVLAREHRWNSGLGQWLPHIEPTLHISLYSNLVSISAHGMKDNESPPLFSQDFSTNNGLICQTLTNRIGPCSDCATNLYLLKVPLDVRVYSGAYFGIWFSPTSSRTWTIPPLLPPYGMMPVTFTACRYHIGTNDAYYFKPLGTSGYYGIPHEVRGNPQMQISHTPGSVTITWDTNETNMWMMSREGKWAVTGNMWTMPITNASQIFWLSK